MCRRAILILLTYSNGLIMSKGRPGGNPEITKYSFKQKYDWNESCTAKLTLRLPPSLNSRLKEQENWTEFARVAIAKALDEEGN